MVPTRPRLSPGQANFLIFQACSLIEKIFTPVILTAYGPPALLIAIGGFVEEKEAVFSSH